VTPKYLLKPARLAGSPLLATQSDERLVDLVRGGSEPAFDAIVARYRGPLLRYCGALLGSERAEDAVQQALVNAYNAMRNDERKLNLKPWLYRIAHNVSLNALRDRARFHEALDEEQAGAEQPDVVVERRERLAEVLAAVRQLPERQRDAILLRELEGRSYEEIADALGVGGGSVRALLNRARNSVRVAATAVTPLGLLLRIPAGAEQAGEGVAARVAELTAGAGAGALASKVAATALVTGAVAGGVALGPGSGDGSGDGSGGRDANSPPPAAASEAPDRSGGSGSPSGSGASGGPLDDDGNDDVRSGRRGGEDEDEDRSGPGEKSGPGGSEGDADSSGPGSAEDQAAGEVEEDRSGPGGGSASSGSGSTGSGSSGSGSSGSGSSGSDSSGSSGSG
jgi:RNA polymerase sigma factor (sigma-70 family)